MCNRTEFGTSLIQLLVSVSRPGLHQHVMARPQVVDISVGTSVPTINNFRALPTPGNAIWPQFLLDIDYQGAQLVQL